MFTIFAAAYGGGHVACLLPVIERLRARGDRVELLALTTAAQVCADRGVEHRRLRDFPGVQDERSRAWGERLAAGVAPNPAVPHDESVAYLGTGYRDLEDAVGVEEASRRWAAEGRGAFLPVASMEALLRDLRPDLVLATSAPRSERAAVLAARRLGIPAVVVVDLFALSEEAWITDPAFGDRICVIAGSVRERLIAGGRRPEQVVVTGNPVFDRLADPAMRAHGAALRRARGWDDRRVVTWASQPEPADPELPRRIEQELIRAARSRSDWQLVLRPHPNEPAFAVPDDARITLNTRADDLHTLLAASDVVMTMTSTVGLEAALLGKPLVTWDRSQNTRFCPYGAMGFSLGVDALDAIGPAIDRALAGGAPRPTLPPIGHGADGVVAQITRLLGA